MKKPILEVKNVSKTFLGIKALQNVNFSCESGEIHVLLGENGAGKSTLLKIISGYLRPDSGNLFIRGEQVFFKNPQEAQDAGIAMVYQELTLLPELTVSQNIFLNNEHHNCIGMIDDNQNRRKVQKIAQKYGIKIDPDELVKDLTIAKQQMIEFLKALVRDPKILILDEPTSALAKDEVKKLFAIIKILKNEGKAIIFISHRIEEIFRIGDKVTILKDGQYIATVKMGEINHTELVNLMVGRPFQSIFPSKLKEISSENIFEVVGLNIKKTLHHISFCVKKGEVLGIAGLKGHGQRELLYCLAGIIPKESGKIYFNSEEVRAKNAVQAIRSGIALVPEDRKREGLLLTLSVKDNLTLASLHLLQKLGFINEKNEKLFSNDMIARLSIETSSLKQYVCFLSGGNQQKVVLGKAMGIKPKVILFDEPTRGIDVEAKQDFYKLMRSFANNGIAVIMYSSDLMEVVGMSDRVLVMYEGKISSELSNVEITEENIMRNAVGLNHSGGKR